MTTTVDHLLPSNATAMERAASQTMGKFSPGRIVPTLWNPQTCPEAVLPHLAWALSIDQWDATWPVQLKRDTIQAAREIQQHKGTPWAIRNALAIMGQPDADIVERSDYPHYNGIPRNGYYRRGGPDQWATYRVVLHNPITIDQAAALTALLATVKRNCVHLVALDFTQAALRYNGAHLRDGSYTRGII